MPVDRAVLEVGASMEPGREDREYANNTSMRFIRPPRLNGTRP